MVNNFTVLIISYWLWRRKSLTNEGLKNEIFINFEHLDFLACNSPPVCKRRIDEGGLLLVIELRPANCESKYAKQIVWLKYTKKAWVLVETDLLELDSYSLATTFPTWQHNNRSIEILNCWTLNQVGGLVDACKCKNSTPRQHLWIICSTWKKQSMTHHLTLARIVMRSWLWLLVIRAQPNTWMKESQWWSSNVEDALTAILLKSSASPVWTKNHSQCSSNWIKIIYGYICFAMPLSTHL